MTSRAALKASLGVRIRQLIVSNFGAVCVALVVVPTAIFLLAALHAGLVARNIAACEFNTIAAVLIFIVTSFLSGGALTLVRIGNDMRQVVRILQHIERAQIIPIADDVHRIERIERDVGSIRHARHRASLPR